MEELDWGYICAAIGNLSGIPVRLYEADILAFSHFSAPLGRDPMLLYKDALWGIEGQIGYYMTDDLSYFGMVRQGEKRIIIGPTRQIPNTDQELRALAFRLGVPPEETEAFSTGMKNILRMPIESMVQMLCVVNYIINGEKLTIRDVEIYDSEQDALKSATERYYAEQANSGQESIHGAVQAQHNTLSLEETVMNIISHGNTAALQEWLAAAPSVRGGTLAAEQLRQRKNLFIVTATLASRAAIRGGMDAEDALSLSDNFIQSCELSSSPDRITNLQYHMILEYTERVERIRKGKSPTKLALAVANYVQHHLSEHISAEAIAKELYLSRPYLSRKFKEETGDTLTDFILKEKTEEAKRLLRYTDKSYSAINAYLGFSSQGHFARTFRKYSGVTPNEYRTQHVQRQR